ncbi:MAG: hypothetical protein KGL42_07980 [Betaproteobacteria bacterium]|nr:hypothetical protein [Betaproteobacteria bacterium]
MTINDTKPTPAQLAKAVQDRHMERVRSITSKYAAPNLTEAQVRQRDDELRDSTNQAARELQFLGRP